MSARSRINVDVTVQQKAEFDFIKDQLGLSNQGVVLAVLLSSYRELQRLKKEMLECSESTLLEDEKKLIDDAVKVSGMSRKEITKRGLISEAKTALTLAKRQDDLDKAQSEDLKKMTFKGVAAKRIGDVISQIMEYNDNQPEQINRFYISESLISKLTGSNRGAIKDYFKNRRVMIDDHNQKYGLTDNDNRKGKGLDLKTILSI